MPGKVCPSRPRESSVHPDIYQVKKIDTFFDCAERIAKRSKRLLPVVKAALFDLFLVFLFIVEAWKFLKHLLSG
jgi:hypothetical protein